MKTSIIAIIDKSTSMIPLTGDTVEGFNKFIEDQKKVDGECDVTCVLFSGDGYANHMNEKSTSIQTLYTALPLTSVPKLTDKEYICQGWTALLDAIGYTVDAAGQRFATMKEGDRPNKVVVLIITDGEENCSRKYSSEQIKSMIKHQEDKYSWEFLYLGANQDAFSVASNLGMKMSNVANYMADSRGTACAYNGFIAKTTMFRSGGNADDMSLSSVVNS